MTAAWPVQKAMSAALKSAPSVTVPVYDGRGVPPPASLPYVTFGSLFELPSDTHTSRGSHTFVTLHIWSDYRGVKEAAEILEAVDAVLDRQPLAVPGYTDVSVARESVSTVPDPNPDLCHMNVRYRVWLTNQ